MQSTQPIELTVDQRIEILKCASQLATARLMTDLDFIGNIKEAFNEMKSLIISSNEPIPLIGRKKKL